MSDPRDPTDAEGLPADETETEPSPTPTDADTDPVDVEQQGGAALANIGKPRGADRLFRD